MQHDHVKGIISRGTSPVATARIRLGSGTSEVEFCTSVNMSGSSAMPVTREFMLEIE